MARSPRQAGDGEGCRQRHPVDDRRRRGAIRRRHHPLVSDLDASGPRVERLLTLGEPHRERCEERVGLWPAIGATSPYGPKTSSKCSSPGERQRHHRQVDPLGEAVECSSSGPPRDLWELQVLHHGDRPYTCSASPGDTPFMRYISSSGDPPLRVVELRRWRRSPSAFIGRSLGSPGSEGVSPTGRIVSCAQRTSKTAPRSCADGGQRGAIATPTAQRRYARGRAGDAARALLRPCLRPGADPVHEADGP